VESANQSIAFNMLYPYPKIKQELRQPVTTLI
jgi:hypothetical protein